MINEKPINIVQFFSVFHYGIAVNLANPQGAKHIVNGQLTVSLYGLNNKIENVPLATTDIIAASLPTSQKVPIWSALIPQFVMPLWNSLSSMLVL